MPADREGKNWSREEHILAFNLYCKIPFGRQHPRAPELIELAKLLRRSPNSVSLKLNNFSQLDPELQARGIKGMAHGAKGEVEIWREFDEDPAALAFESERLLAQFTGRKLEQLAEIDERDLRKEGLERERMVRVRVNQHFAAYDYKCCITGIAIPELLVASHIVPWADDPKQRMNPRNGLCLNALSVMTATAPAVFSSGRKRTFISEAVGRDSAPASSDFDFLETVHHLPLRRRLSGVAWPNEFLKGRRKMSNLV